jgi:hypothetical protein
VRQRAQSPKEKGETFDVHRLNRKGQDCKSGRSKTKGKIREHTKMGEFNPITTFIPVPPEFQQGTPNGKVSSSLCETLLLTVVEGGEHFVASADESLGGPLGLADGIGGGDGELRGTDNEGEQEIDRGGDGGDVRKGGRRRGVACEVETELGDG